MPKHFAARSAAAAVLAFLSFLQWSPEDGSKEDAISGVSGEASLTPAAKGHAGWISHWLSTSLPEIEHWHWLSTSLPEVSYWLSAALPEDVTCNVLPVIHSLFGLAVFRHIARRVASKALLPSCMAPAPALEQLPARVCICSGSQTEGDAAVPVVDQALDALQKECDSVAERLATALLWQEELQERYLATSCELDTVREALPELGRQVRMQDAKLERRSRYIQRLLLEIYKIDQLLRSNESWQRDAEAENARERQRLRSLQASIDACQKSVQSQQEQSLDLQNVREEMLTLRAKIDAERHMIEQLEANMREVAPAQLQHSSAAKECEGLRRGPDRQPPHSPSSAPAGAPSVLRRALQFEAQSRGGAGAAVATKGGTVLRAQAVSAVAIDLGGCSEVAPLLAPRGENSQRTTPTAERMSMVPTPMRGTAVSTSGSSADSVAETPRGHTSPATGVKFAAGLCESLAPKLSALETIADHNSLLKEHVIRMGNCC